jgi:hypothetical protein
VAGSVGDGGAGLGGVPCAGDWQWAAQSGAVETTMPPSTASQCGGPEHVELTCIASQHHWAGRSVSDWVGPYLARPPSGQVADVTGGRVDRQR